MLNIHSDTWIDVEKINDNINLLKSCFKEALIINKRGDLAKNLDNPKLLQSDISSNAKMFSLLFQLYNLSEENAAVNFRRNIETEKGLGFFPSLSGASIKSLKEKKISSSKVKQTLNDLFIELVLTAHPTEAKRPEVLIQLRELYLLIVENNITHQTQYEKETLRKKIINAILQLWKTSEVFFEKPKVEDELKWVIYYFTHVFPEVIVMLSHRIKQAWNEAFPKRKQYFPTNFSPNIRMATWVGGDRDGHPIVNHQTTANSLLTLRRKSLQMIQVMLFETSKKIRIDNEQTKKDNSFENWVSNKIKKIGKDAQFWTKKYPHQIIRQALIGMSIQIPVDNHGNNILKDAQPYHYTCPETLIADLEKIYHYLIKIKCKIIADLDINPLIKTVSLFGFHLAKLDIRQNSSYHEKAFIQILEQKKIIEQYPKNTEDKLSLLNSLLANPKNILSDKDITALKPEAKEVMLTCKVINTQIENGKTKTIGNYIVSMTHSHFDLLLVYFFFKEANILKIVNKKLYSPIPVVPLLETISDLKNSYGILKDFINHPIPKATYRKRKNTSNIDQLIMIGYSDSNKDGGIISSLWSLHKTQKNLEFLANEHNLKFGYFHGIGGSISRGAGPIHRFMSSQPPSTLNSYFRITEQGETIVQKYANRLTALFNIELLTAGVLVNTLRTKYTSKHQKQWLEVMDFLAYKSYNKYRSLLEHPHFISFYSQATPIDLIEQSRIGSRPSRRSGKRTLDDLRAIPWVFSWSQSRFFLSGWFGVGTALEALENNNKPFFDTLIKNYQDFPSFRYILTNITTALLRSDDTIMKQYSLLVKDKHVRTEMMNIILDEKRKTEHYLTNIYNTTIYERRPRTKLIMEYRKDILYTLHNQQIQKLKQWREVVEKKETKKGEAFIPELLLLLNAIAAGLKTTG